MLSSTFLTKTVIDWTILFLWKLPSMQQLLSILILLNVYFWLSLNWIRLWFCLVCAWSLTNFTKYFSLSKICTSVWIIQELSECRNFLWDLQSVRLWIHMNNFIFWHKTSFSYFSDILLQMKSFCKNLSRKMKKEIVLRKLLDPHYNNNYLVLEENHSHLGSYFPNVIR